MAFKILDKISEKTHLGKKALLVMFAGLLGIILLIVSELLPEKTAENKKDEDISVTSYEQYAENIEEKAFCPDLSNRRRGRGKGYGDS